MEVLAVANQKGGTGKTTTAVNIAAAAVEQGRRVLVLDLDAQRSASVSLLERGDVPGDNARGLIEVLTDGRALLELVRPTSAPGVDLVPGSAFLAAGDKLLAGEPGAEGILRGAIGALPARWDLVLADCPPNLGLITVNALTAASGVLIVTEPSYLALPGLRDLNRTIDAVGARLNPSLTTVGILICRCRARVRLGQDVIAQLRETFGGVVFDATIRETIRIAEAPAHGRSVLQYAPHCDGAEDYRRAATELLNRIGGAHGEAQGGLARGNIGA